MTAPLGGNNPGSLVQQLQSITPVGTNGQTAGQYANQAAQVIQNANQTTENSFRIFGNLVNFDLFSQYQSQNSSNGNRRLTAAQRSHQNQQNQVNSAIGQAFTTYLNSIVAARTNTLFANPGTGTLDLSGNVANYNSQIASATITLGNSLTSTLGRVRGGLTSLQPSLIHSLFDPNTGLVSQLINLPAPTDLSGLNAQGYNGNVFGLINTAYQDALGRVNAFNQNAKTNFSTFNQFGNNSFVPTVGSNGFFTGQSSSGTGNGSGTGTGNSGGSTSAFRIADSISSRNHDPLGTAL